MNYFFSFFFFFIQRLIQRSVAYFSTYIGNLSCITLKYHSPHSTKLTIVLLVVHAKSNNFADGLMEMQNINTSGGPVKILKLRFRDNVLFLCLLGTL